MVRFLKRMILTNLQLSVALRLAFLITTVVGVIKHCLFIATWSFFFRKYKEVQGWSFTDLILMSGIVAFSIGVVEAFFYGLRELPRRVETGELDVFLLQPKNIILNLAMSKGDLTAVGDIAAGIFLISYSGYVLKAFPLILLILAASIVFIFALFLYLSSLCFFMQNSKNFIRELYQNAFTVTGQPASAYRGFFKLVTLTILPVSFLNFFPVEYFRTNRLMYLSLALIGTLIFFAFSCWIFYRGLKKYESGNLSCRRL